jgi:diacylglycerol O-acyltransferase / wax synthase
MRSRGRETMRGADSAWWHMEEPTGQMVITAVLTFDGGIQLSCLRRTLEERLLRFRRFRQRIVEPRFGIGLPRWEDDPHFSVDRHLFAASLPEPGDRAALEALVGDLMSRTLDYERPLWQFHLVEDFEGGSALVARLHHSIADGLALIHVLLSLDDVPGNESVADTWAAGQSLLRRGSGGRGRAPLASQILGAGRSLFGLLGKRFDPPTPLRGPLGVRKRVAWSEPVPLEEVRDLGRALGATLNDVITGAIAGALRRYLQERGVAAGGRPLNAVVPVNLRAASDVGALGNHFGLVFVALPVDEPEPVARLRAVRREMDALKVSPQAMVVYGLLQLFGHAPRWLERLLVNFLGRKATIVMTNVPGPRESISLCGKRLSGLMAWVPQSGRLGVGVSVLSYAGMLQVGVATDEQLVPDPGRLVADLQQELEALREQVRATGTEVAG